MSMKTGVLLLLGVVVFAGCSQSPTRPTSPTVAESSTSQNPSRGVVVASDFSVALSQTEDATIVRPTVDFSETSGRVGVTLKEVSFLMDVPGSPLTVTLGSRIPPGGTYAFPSGPEMRLAPGATTVRLKAVYVDDNGFTGSATAEASVYALEGRTRAAVVISTFTVLGSRRAGGRFDYIPILSLAETGGVSGATIIRVSFTLLNVGPAGNVPPWNGAARVPAGGSVDLLRQVSNAYGDPDLEIDSLAEASTVGVVISFADDAGRLGSLSAVAAVKR
jgi:hypothetical protein